LKPAAGSGSPRFSFIIPFYNCTRYLQRAIDSVLAQEGNDWELLLVDDGSADAPQSLLAPLAGDARIRLLTQENAGPGAARNLGAAHARGDYLWFLDCDDELTERALERVRDHLDRHPDIEMLVGGHRVREADGRQRLRLPDALGSDREENFRNFIRKKIGGFSPGAILVKRQVFHRLRYPTDIRNNEDIVLWAQILARHQCASLAYPLVTMHRRGDSLRHQAIAEKTTDRIVEHLFDPAILPANLMALRNEFRASRKLSRFRALCLAGCNSEARRLFLETAREYPQALLKWSYLKKYLRLWLKSDGNGPD
jgi:glycosyltransferase involved in cell wall biosynthesis